MERLTKRESNNEAVPIHGDAGWYGKIVKKLADYEDAKENGRLAVLPCKPYTTVYCTNTGKIVVDEVKQFGFDGELWFRLESTNNVKWTITRFGKTVFLSPEEARAALRVEL